MVHEQAAVLEDTPFDDDAALPPYTPSQPTLTAPSRHSHEPNERATFDTIQDHIAAAKHSHDIYEMPSGIEICRDARTTASAEPLFRISMDERNSTGVCEVTMRNRADEIVAGARFRPRQRNNGFETYVGRHKPPTDDDWIPVECVSGGVLKPDAYKFRARGRLMAWRRAREVPLGAKSLRVVDHDYRLLDESDIGKNASSHGRSHVPYGTKTIKSGVAVAEYRAAKSKALFGSINWGDEQGDLELAALIVFATIMFHSQSCRAG